MSEPNYAEAIERLQESVARSVVLLQRIERRLEGIDRASARPRDAHMKRRTVIRQRIGRTDMPREQVEEILAARGHVIG